jgi:hypothetical protein
VRGDKLDICVLECPSLAQQYLGALGVRVGQVPIVRASLAAKSSPSP